MTLESQAWLSREEMIFHRMESFHRQRVEAHTSGKKPVEGTNTGVLVLHLIPQESVERRIQFTASELKSHGRTVPPLGGQRGTPKFNADGVTNCGMDGFTQLFRTGRLEGVMQRATFERDGFKVIRDTTCETALFTVVPPYLQFCKGIGLKLPIWLFTSLVGCKGARFRTDPTFPDLTEDGIDRDVVFLPDLEITTFEVDAQTILRPLCDAMWQSAGAECSLNYGNDGKWRERTR